MARDVKTWNSHSGVDIEAVLARNALPEGSTDLVTLKRINGLHSPFRDDGVHIGRSGDGPE